jgi:hypothetical protein
MGKKKRKFCHWKEKNYWQKEKDDGDLSLKRIENIF